MPVKGAASITGFNYRIKMFDFDQIFKIRINIEVEKLGFGF